MTISQALLRCLLVAVGTLNVANAASFRCFEESINQFTATPIDQPLGIASCLKKQKDTVIHAQGDGYKNNGTETIAIIQAYIALGNINVILLDWEEEAQGGLLGTAGYLFTANKAIEIGIKVGKAVAVLINNGVLRQNSTYVSGFSLGAHLMGRAGEELQKYNYNFTRIFGIDPAGPGFSYPVGFRGLDYSQAPVVIVIHTNCGLYGSSQSLGTIDFWANCAPVCTIAGQRQPGCPDGIQPPMKACDHIRAVYYYIESLNGSFPAAFANSCSEWESQSSSNVITNNFGNGVDTSKEGNFYFSTNSQSPYSKGQAGLTFN